MTAPRKSASVAEFLRYFPPVWKPAKAASARQETSHEEHFSDLDWVEGSSLTSPTPGPDMLAAARETPQDRARRLQAQHATRICVRRLPTRFNKNPNEDLT
ncbi:MAG: hypothetical protein ACSLE9_05460 [Burkholderiaceae bacterium]